MVDDAGAAGDRDGGAARDGGDATEPALRVLFIGNSYTSVNDLPSVIARLGESADPPQRFDVAQYTPGGQTWEGHDADPAVDALIREGWDFVVLQDQSQQPWWGPPLEAKPALLSLDAKIRAASAQTVLYMTWARQGDNFYQDMLVDSYYVQAGEAVDARVAPVGRAWERALRDPSMTLHADDGSHPNARGTYLAACVLYATITERSPIGLGDGGLDVSAGDAETLQRAASDAIAARQRPAPPLLGSWPLSSERSGNDLIPSAELALGDTVGPDGGPSSATSFSPGRYAAVPYFAGLDAANVTITFEAYRADWSEPTEQRESLLDRDEIYAIHLEGTTLTATVFAPPVDGAPAALPGDPHRRSPYDHRIHRRRPSSRTPPSGSLPVGIASRSRTTASSTRSGSTAAKSRRRPWPGLSRAPTRVPAATSASRWESTAPRPIGSPPRSSRSRARSPTSGSTRPRSAPNRSRRCSVRVGQCRDDVTTHSVNPESTVRAKRPQPPASPSTQVGHSSAHAPWGQPPSRELPSSELPPGELPSRSV